MSWNKSSANTLTKTLEVFVIYEQLQDAVREANIETYQYNRIDFYGEVLRARLEELYPALFRSITYQYVFLVDVAPLPLVMKIAQDTRRILSKNVKVPSVIYSKEAQTCKEWQMQQSSKCCLAAERVDVEHQLGTSSLQTPSARTEINS